MAKNRFRHFLTTVAAFCAVLYSTSCATFNKHMFEQADKNSTGVLCIGMETSKKYGSCPGAKIDAERMHIILQNYSNHATLLVSEQAVKAVVVQKMVEVCQKDLAIIFYSGHGGAQKQSSTTKQNWAEPTGQDQFLCLYDAPMLDDEIWNVICRAKGRVVLICDCCHSATMFREPISFEKKRSAETFSVGKDPDLWYVGGCIDQGYSYGSDAGGLLTNAIVDKFSKTKTYEDMWLTLHGNKILNKSEQVQHTELGKSFKDYLIFR